MRATRSPAPNGDAARYRIPSLERALRVLEELDRHPAGRSMIDVARALRLPKNSVFRITTTLLHHGYLERDPETRLLTLSRKVLALGYRAATEGGLVERALPAMRALRDRVHETVVLTLLIDGEGFILEQVQGTHPFRFVADPGTRQPHLHTSASTKAILAHLPPAEREARLRRIRYVRCTPRTIARAADFREELRRVRRRGYALDRGEHMRGVHCVAAPVLDRTGYPVASLTVTGPVDRMPEATMDALGGVVREHADHVSGRLGYKADAGEAAGN